MADTHETIADIIAEMRGMGNYQRYSGDHARVLADRFEAAHRRERGDVAKLREALDESRRIASGLGGCRLNDYWKLNEIVRVCEAALSAPPRNCDRFASADEAIGAYRQTHKYMVVNVFLDWLFATATEKEGGNDAD